MTIPSRGRRGESEDKRASLSVRLEDLACGASARDVRFVDDHALRIRQRIHSTRESLQGAHLNGRGRIRRATRLDRAYGESERAEPVRGVVNDLFEVCDKSHAPTLRDRRRDHAPCGEMRLPAARGQLEEH